MTEERSEREAHLRAITITALTAVAGIAAAAGSAYFTRGQEAAYAARMPQVLVAIAILAQLPVYSVVYDDWGGPKDALFVAFMTFSFWFISWGIMLQTGALY